MLVQPTWCVKMGEVIEKVEAKIRVPILSSGFYRGSASYVFCTKRAINHAHITNKYIGVQIALGKGTSSNSPSYCPVQGPPSSSYDFLPLSAHPLRSLVDGRLRPELTASLLAHLGSVQSPQSPLPALMAALVLLD